MPDHAEKMLQIIECGLCDDYGKRGLYVCDHIDYAEIARRHMPAIRDLLSKGRKI